MESSKKFFIFINIAKIGLPLCSTPTGFGPTGARRTTSWQIITCCCISTKTTFLDVRRKWQFSVFQIIYFFSILQYNLKLIKSIQCKSCLANNSKPTQFRKRIKTSLPAKNSPEKFLLHIHHNYMKQFLIFQHSFRHSYMSFYKFGWIFRTQCKKIFVKLLE